ncbi:MAG: class I SAM-dependent methyltransferase [Chloroflexi bacterium]|nr:class I SAM-dependent methyltransferase [Chloroflexota bacterium]
MSNKQSDHNPEHPSAWFEPLYAQAKGNPADVPWARLRPDPAVSAWIDQLTWISSAERGLVVGSGLGDDAEALAQTGAVVTAFDVSPSAVEWARQRFPHSPVDYQVADLLNPPPDWHQAFDLIVEVRTIQSLPPEVQPQAARQIAAFCAPGGRLLVAGMLHDDGRSVSGPPWPIARSTLDAMEASGLSRSRFKQSQRYPGIWAFEALFTRR